MCKYEKIILCDNCNILPLAVTVEGYRNLILFSAIKSHSSNFPIQRKITVIHIQYSNDHLKLLFIILQDIKTIKKIKIIIILIYIKMNWLLKFP